MIEKLWFTSQKVKSSLVILPLPILYVHILFRYNVQHISLDFHHFHMDCIHSVLGILVVVEMFHYLTD